MTAQPEIIFSIALDGQGGALDVAPSGKSLRSEAKFTWSHLGLADEDVEPWLTENAELDPVVIGALLEEDTRPRSLIAEDGLLLILRGFIFNPGAEPNDLVSIRIWIDAQRAITLRHRRVAAPQEVKSNLERGTGPKNPGDLLLALSDALTARLTLGIQQLEESADQIEEEVLSLETDDVRAQLADLRRQLISVRRHVSPQRDVLTRLVNADLSWLSDQNRAQLRELANQSTRLVEELDAVRERAAISQEELNTRISEQLNTRMYSLSIIAGIFLPLGLLTGLLGINLPGIPGAESPRAFTIFCVLLAGVGAFQLWLYRKWRWL
ncbi:MAG: zinc transporter ZntB [Myxococcota bacterium]